MRTFKKPSTAKKHAKVVAKRIFSLILTIILLALAYVVFINIDWITYKINETSVTVNYGLTWMKDYDKAFDVATKQEKDVLLVFMDDKNDKCKHLCKEIFPRKAFKVIQNNYVLFWVNCDTKDLLETQKDFVLTLQKRYKVNNQTAMFVVVPPADKLEKESKNIRRIEYGNESIEKLLNKIAGDKFKAKKISKTIPKLKIPFVTK